MFNSVDIYCPPSPKSNSDVDCEITIGDLHSNALLFIYFLQQHKIVSLTDEQYKLLVHEYVGLEQLKETPTAGEEILARTQKIVAIIESLSIINKPKLRLIGDETADRGVNDLFILLILKKLGENQVPYKILLSNHGLCFISLFLVWCKQNKQVNWMLHPTQMNSFTALKQSVESGIFAFEKLKQWVDTYYFPFIEVIDYSLCPQSTRLTLYSHAPIGFNHLFDLAYYTKTPMHADDMLELAESIERIQEKFKKVIFPTLCKYLMNMTNFENAQRAEQRINVIKESILWTICWNREYSSEVINRPNRYNSFFLRYVHGHDHEFHNSSHCISLDGFLGKSSEDNIGELKELKSKDINLKEYLLIKKSGTSWRGFFTNLISQTDYKPYYPWVGLFVACILVKKYSCYQPSTLLKNIFYMAKNMLGFKAERHAVNNMP